MAIHILLYKLNSTSVSVDCHLWSIRGQRNKIMTSLLTFKLFNCIKQIDSMLACICSVLDHRWCQNVERTIAFCSYHILTSSVIYCWTYAWEHGIYLLIRCHQVKKNSCHFCFGIGPQLFVAYCLLGLSYYAVFLSEWVSECNNRIQALNELCQFQSDGPQSLKLPRRWSFLQIIIFTKMLLCYTFVPSVVKYDILR